MKLGRYWWIFAGVLLLVSTGVSLALPRGFALTAYGDFVALFLFLTATAVLVRNAVTSQGQTRAF